MRNKIAKQLLWVAGALAVLASPLPALAEEERPIGDGYTHSDRSDFPRERRQEVSQREEPVAQPYTEEMY